MRPNFSYKSTNLKKIRNQYCFIKKYIKSSNVSKRPNTSRNVLYKPIFVKKINEIRYKQFLTKLKNADNLLFLQYDYADFHLEQPNKASYEVITNGFFRAEDFNEKITRNSYSVYLIWNKKIVGVVNFFPSRDGKRGRNPMLETYTTPALLTNYSKDSVFIANGYRIIGVIKSVFGGADAESVELPVIPTVPSAEVPKIVSRNSTTRCLTTLLSHYLKPIISYYRNAHQGTPKGVSIKIKKLLAQIKFFSNRLKMSYKKKLEWAEKEKLKRSEIWVLRKLKYLLLVTPIRRLTSRLKLKKAILDLRADLKKFPIFTTKKGNDPIERAYSVKDSWISQPLKSYRCGNLTNSGSIYATNKLKPVKSSVEEVCAEKLKRASLLFSVYRTFYLYFSLAGGAPRSKLLNNIEEYDTKNKPLKTLFYKLMFNFKKHYLYITLLHKKKKKNTIYFALNTGLFLKFFSFKKSLKKSKSLKLLLMRYLRKLLILSRINNFNLYIKQTSDQLNKLIQTLQKPLNHSFTDPLTGLVIDEESSKTPRELFNFIYIIFLKNKPFGTMKLKNSGRLKRRIRRRITNMNRIID